MFFLPNKGGKKKNKKAECDVLLQKFFRYLNVHKLSPKTVVRFFLIIYFLISGRIVDGFYSNKFTDDLIVD